MDAGLTQRQPQRAARRGLVTHTRAVARTSCARSAGSTVGGSSTSRVAGQTGRGWLEVEECGHHLDGANTISDRMVRANDDERTSVRESLDEDRFPQGMCWVEWCRCPATGPGESSIETSVAGCRDPAYVPGAVEGPVVDPRRTPRRPRRPSDALTHPWHGADRSIEGGLEPVRGKGTRQHEGHGHDGPRGGPGVALQQELVQGGQIFGECEADHARHLPRCAWYSTRTAA